LTDQQRAQLRDQASYLKALAPQLPAVPTHGDCQPRNLLWDPISRQLAVIDFEKAAPAPAVRDLTLFEAGSLLDREDLRHAFYQGFGRALSHLEHSSALRYREAPVNIPFGLTEDETVLVVCAHPDDETLGAGGTIHRLSGSGVTVHVLAVCCYPNPGPGTPSDTGIRAKEFEAACDVLGVAKRAIAWTDDDRARSPGLYLRDLVTLIDCGRDISLAAARPAALLIPSASSFHPDHQAVHQAGIAAARPTGLAGSAPRIVLGFTGPEDGWSAMPDHRPVFIDTTASWPAKEQALQAHQSQLRDDTHPRSLSHIRTIDTAAGATVGFGMAERFTPYRLAYP
jgi:LmbE family N-acetylglucosaminyl deacetylase